MVKLESWSILIPLINNSRNLDPEKNFHLYIMYIIDIYKFISLGIILFH